MWIILGLLAAISEASKSVTAKRNIKHFDTLVVTWAWSTFSLLVLLPVMFLKGLPHLDSTFWVALAIGTVTGIVSQILYGFAIKHTDLSLSLPMLALTPVFLLFTGFVINHEFPNTLGLIGVIVIVAGAYFLNFKRGEKVYQPFLAIGKDKGALMMLGVALTFALNGNLTKVALVHSNPYFYTALARIVLSIVLTPVALISSKQDFKRVLELRNLPRILPVGILEGITILTQTIAQSISLVVLVVSLKRTSIIFSSVMGWLVFGEPIKKRIIPISSMVLGIILIAWP